MWNTSKQSILEGEHIMVYYAYGNKKIIENSLVL